MNSAENVESKPGWLDRPLYTWIPRITIEHIVIALIILMAVLSRFYAVGLRVMSHDEVNHVVPSYELYQGRGYAHDPVTHGPLQLGTLILHPGFQQHYLASLPSCLFCLLTAATCGEPGRCWQVYSS